LGNYILAAISGRVRPSYHFRSMAFVVLTIAVIMLTLTGPPQTGRSCRFGAWTLCPPAFGDSAPATTSPASATSPNTSTSSKSADLDSLEGEVDNVKIEKGDVIGVTVTGEQNLCSDYTVDADGNITLPIAGKVQVAGLNSDGATAAITKVLKSYYVSPNVTVVEKSAQGLSVTVEGDVITQGPVQIDKKGHLADALGQAGLGTDADTTKVAVTRRKASGEAHKYTIDYSQFTANADVASNPLLKDGDFIFVPAKVIPKLRVSVLGDVNAPGDVTIDNNTPISVALGRAGGLAGDADHHMIQVEHAKSTTPVLYDLDAARQHPLDTTYDPLAQDGDRIIVPAAAPPKTFQILGAVNRPGEITVDGPVSLTDAIALAGGLAPHAKLNNVSITRDKGPGLGYQMLKVDATDVKVASAVIVKPSDVINIDQGKGHSVNVFQALSPLAALSPLFWLLHP